MNKFVLGAVAGSLVGTALGSYAVISAALRNEEILEGVAKAISKKTKSFLYGDGEPPTLEYYKARSSQETYINHISGL